jgi:hypothetical protein
MSHFRHLFVMSALSIGMFAGCAQGEDSPEWENYQFRCADAGVGLVGLELVEIAGTPTIGGQYGGVFSNELVTLAGSFDLEGSAVSGGRVAISGGNLPGGGIIEGAEKVDRPDTTADVVAARTDNDNARIPCIGSGNKCTSPVVNGALSLNAKQQITLTTGSYYFTSISINGQAQLNVDGDVVIYLDGPATFNGGSATNPDEDSLAIISASTEEIKLNGGAESAMHILAPFATVRFAGTQGFHGTALANILRINGTADINVSDSVAFVGSSCDDEPADAPAGDGGGQSGPNDRQPRGDDGGNPDKGV